MNGGDNLRAFMRTAEQWICECGERANPVSSKWRWNGKDWEHHHGYPIGHVAARRRGKPPAQLSRICVKP